MCGKVALIWIAVISGIIGTVSGQFPDLDLPLPLNLHLERNWQVSPSASVGTVVARVFQESDHEKQVTFSLKGPGPSIPFAIDNATGVVTVNDTLKDKENQTYSLWVIANYGTLQQSTEVFAIITDRPGYKHIGHPFRPPQFPQFPLRPPTIPKLPAEIPMKPHMNNLMPKQATEKTTTKPIATTIPATTATYPTKNIEENVENTISETPKTEDIRGVGTNDTEEVKAEESDISLTIIPIAAISGLVAVTAVVVAVLWKRNILYKCNVEDSKKDVKAKDSNGIVLQDSINIWNGPRAYSNRYEPWDNNHLQVTEETSTTTVKEDERDEWEFPRHKLRIFNIVGEGAFGQVWRAQATDIDGKKGEVTVAVKTLKENATLKEKSDLLQELDVMKNLGTHLNVVRLVGCCTEKEPTFVIMEFVSLGKLQSFLRDSRASRHYGNTHGGSRSLTSRDLTHFAYQVARGMDFLTSKGIIHRDLAARNVLINEERTCKVADFGFARDVGGAHVYERKSDGRLPIRWMAPESLYDDIFSVKSDIWSFGVLIWEIVTLGSTPYPGLSAGDVMRKVREGHRLEKPEHCKRELYNIMFYCWEADPDSRPDFAECVSLLEKLLCTETDYIELERFPDHSYYNVQNLEGEKV